MKGRPVLFSMLFAVIWTVCVAATPVVRAQGNVGEHYGQAMCYTTGDGIRQLWVGAPQIWASPVSHPGNVVVIGNQHPQWVAFKVHLFYSSDLANWQHVTNGPWYAAQVGDVVNTLQPSQWWNYDTQTYEGALENWNLNWRGYYRVAIQYYWWPDDLTGSGYDYIWAQEYSDYGSTLNQGTVDSCAV